MSAQGEDRQAEAARQGVAYATLGPADLDRVYTVHMAAMDAVGDPGLVKPEDRAFFARLLAGEGRLLGALRDGALIGYGVLQLHLPPSEDARPWLGLPAEEGLAKLAGAGVRPGDWGAGLHDVFIAWRVAEARRLGVTHLYATAAPGNPRSWTNLLAGGFVVRGLEEKYGGHLRYLMWRRAETPATADAEAEAEAEAEATAEPPPDAAAGAHPSGPAASSAAPASLPAGDARAEGRWIPAEDASAQRAALDAGGMGLRWRRRSDGGRDLWYARP